MTNGLTTRPGKRKLKVQERAVRYPWARWLSSRNPVRLRRGTDYASQTVSMMVLCRLTAARPEWRARIGRLELHVDPDGDGFSLLAHPVGSKVDGRTTRHRK